MSFVLAVILFTVGLLMLLKPKIIWEITEQWKSYASEEPSSLYIKSIGLGGILCILAGTASLIVFLLK